MPTTIDDAIRAGFEETNSTPASGWSCPRLSRTHDSFLLDNKVAAASQSDRPREETGVRRIRWRFGLVSFDWRRD